MSNIPAMTTIEALGSIPDFVHKALGERALSRCLEKACLPPSTEDCRREFVPEIAIDKFIDTAAKISGDGLLGIQLSKFLSVREYGLWGQYILSAPTLRMAIERAIATIVMHANVDALYLVEERGIARFGYCFGERKSHTYANVAISAAGVVLSIPRHYLGASWTPKYLALDIEKPQPDSEISDAFGCPVIFNHHCIEIGFDCALLNAANETSDGASIITKPDLWREYQGGPPKNYLEILTSELRLRLGSVNLSIDKVAMALGTSTRTMQRRLDAEGVSFRELLQEIKMRRACEMLSEGVATVTETTYALGYSSPSHFSRAFKSRMGVSPNRYHQRDV